MKRSGRQLLKRTARAALVIAGLIVVAAAWGLWRLHQKPAWYAPADASSEENASRGEYLENQLITQFHKVRESGEDRWTVELDQEWINAWLATRFPLWAQNRDISAANQVEGLNVSLAKDEIRFGLTLLTGVPGRVVSLSCRPEIDAQGRLGIHGTTLRLGRLALPVSWLADSLQLPTEEFAPAQAILDGQPIDAVVRLSDGRQVRILELDLKPGLMRLVLETVR